jgi:acetyl esterase/lipase
VVGVLLAGCGGASSPPAVVPSVTPTAFVDAGSQPYRAEVASLTSRLFLPEGSLPTSLPVVVLVPGGGWSSADPTGLAPLAQTLASHGIATLTTTYRTSSDQAFFPVPVEDVVCAVDDAAARVRAAGATPGPVVVVGHSAGAQLAALAALTARDHQDGCAEPLVEPDGLVGLAGPYDVVAAASLAQLLFAQPLDADPATWAAGNPLEHVDLRPDLVVRLLHGQGDQVVPVSFSEDFASALERAGHDVRLTVLPGIDHQAVYLPESASGPIEELVAELGGAASPASA